MDRIACVITSTRGDRADIVLDRRASLNALSSQLLDELDSALTEISRSSARVVVISGAGDRAFSAGADIGELGEDEAVADRWLAEGQRIFHRIEAFDRPVVAGLTGLALGGGLELALACHILIAADTARLGLPEPTLGLIPGLGGTQRLTRLLGAHRANRLLLTGETISAAEAHDLGLLSYPPCPADALDQLVDSVCERISGLSYYALSAIRRASLAAVSPAADEGYAVERRLAAQAVACADGRAGIAGFLAKRPVQFATPPSGESASA
jgi:enoyl-CoA hydratase